MIRKQTVYSDGELITKNDKKIKVSVQLHYELVDFYGDHARKSYPRFPVATFSWVNSNKMLHVSSPLFNIYPDVIQKLILEKFLWIFNDGPFKYGDDPVRLTFVPKFGCSCGCSPAWRIRGLSRCYNRKQFSVTFSIHIVKPVETKENG